MLGCIELLRASEPSQQGDSGKKRQTDGREYRPVVQRVRRTFDASGSSQQSQPALTNEQQFNAQEREEKNFSKGSIVYAARFGDFETVRNLLDDNSTGSLPKADLLLSQDRIGNTALLWAIGGSHLDIIMLLLERAKSEGILWTLVSRASHQGMTTLMNAAIQGRADIVRLILKAAYESKPSNAAFEAFINAQDRSLNNKGQERLRTAIQQALRFGTGALKGEKEQHSSQEVYAVIKEILNYDSPDIRVNITLPDNKGKTPIYWAAHDGLSEVLKAFEEVARRQNLNKARFFAEIKSGEEARARIRTYSSQSSSSSSRGSVSGSSSGATRPYDSRSSSSSSSSSSAASGK
jgi:hypothetical protein